MPSKKTLVDLAERAGWTFAQAFAAALTIGSFTDLHALKLAAVAGAYAIVKWLGVKANSYLGSTPPKPPTS